MTPFKWSKELINEVDETRIQGPLGLSSRIDVLMLTEGDLELERKCCFLDRSARGITRDMEQRGG